MTQAEGQPGDLKEEGMALKDPLALGGGGTQAAATYSVWLSSVTGAFLTGDSGDRALNPARPEDPSSHVTLA